jgi:hypothetical protein
VVVKHQESFAATIDRLVMWAQAGDEENVNDLFRKIIPQYSKHSLSSKPAKTSLDTSQAIPALEALSTALNH